MNMIKIAWNIAGHGDFVLQHELWLLSRQTREKETDILYARRYKSQDEIETFLTAFVHLVEGQKKSWKVSENSRIPYGIWNIYLHANLLRA
jgi:hypothetical protein